MAATSGMPSRRPSAAASAASSRPRSYSPRVISQVGEVERDERKHRLVPAGPRRHAAALVVLDRPVEVACVHGRQRNVAECARDARLVAERLPAAERVLGESQLLRIVAGERREVAAGAHEPRRRLRLERVRVGQALGDPTAPLRDHRPGAPVPPERGADPRGGAALAGVAGPPERRAHVVVVLVDRAQPPLLAAAAQVRLRLLGERARRTRRGPP